MNDDVRFIGGPAAGELHCIPEPNRSCDVMKGVPPNYDDIMDMATEHKWSRSTRYNICTVPCVTLMNPRQETSRRFALASTLSDEERRQVLVLLHSSAETALAMHDGLIMFMDAVTLDLIEKGKQYDDLCR